MYTSLACMFPAVEFLSSEMQVYCALGLHITVVGSGVKPLQEHLSVSIPNDDRSPRRFAPPLTKITLTASVLYNPHSRTSSLRDVRNRTLPHARCFDWCSTLICSCNSRRSRP